MPEPVAAARELVAELLASIQPGEFTIRVDAGKLAALCLLLDVIERDPRDIVLEAVRLHLDLGLRDCLGVVWVKETWVAGPEGAVLLGGVEVAPLEKCETWTAYCVLPGGRVQREYLLACDSDASEGAKRFLAGVSLALQSRVNDHIDRLAAVVAEYGSCYVPSPSYRSRLEVLALDKGVARGLFEIRDDLIVRPNAGGAAADPKAETSKKKE